LATGHYLDLFADVTEPAADGVKPQPTLY